jgi:hypothetical protein
LTVSATAWNGSWNVSTPRADTKKESIQRGSNPSLSLQKHRWAMSGFHTAAPQRA